jgi:hypothetical protein
MHAIVISNASLIPAQGLVPGMVGAPAFALAPTSTIATEMETMVKTVMVFITFV